MKFTSLHPVARKSQSLGWVSEITVNIPELPGKALQIYCCKRSSGVITANLKAGTADARFFTFTPSQDYSVFAPGSTGTATRGRIESACKEALEWFDKQGCYQALLDHYASA